MTTSAKSPVVLITGALTGIARATALAYAAAGARIVVSGRHDEAGAALVVELRGKVRKPSSFAPMSATRKTSARWSTGRWPASAASTLR